MSKRTLSKELALMDADQLRQVILDAYSVNKDFAAYFEYFLNPDPEALYEKTVAKLHKEIFRFKYGQTKARVSIISREVKAFAAFQPGADYEMKLLLHLVATFAALDRARYSLPKPIVTGIQKYIVSYFTIANREGCIEKALDDYQAVVDEASDSRFFRRFLLRQAELAFEDLKIPTTPLKAKS